MKGVDPIPCDQILVNVSSERLQQVLAERDLGSGVADCGCVVMDYRFYACKKHSGGARER